VVRPFTVLVVKSGDGFTTLPLYHAKVNPAVTPPTFAVTDPEFAVEQMISVAEADTTGFEVRSGTALEFMDRQPVIGSVTSTVYVRAFRPVAR
jgi:hypothetical protein